MNPTVGTLLPRAERPFGNYELICRLATGGMAEIYLASQHLHGERQLLVIKRVLPHLLEESRFVAMFRDEARLAARIVHPNVCRVFDWGMVQQNYFIAMEYLQGVPLSRMLLRAARTNEQLAIPVVLGIMMQCCQGLHHAHNLSTEDGTPLDVVHRDVSPPNIFVTSEGYAKLLDFGVAKARGATQTTRTGTVKGKSSYMSPEQTLGEEVDRRSDVFSVGIVLWEALTAKRLFARETDFLTFSAITESEIPDVRESRPELGDALAAVVARALARDREDRYQSAAELASALGRAANGEGAGATRAQLGIFIAEHFADDLSSKARLTRNITEQLSVVENSEVDEHNPERSKRETQFLELAQKPTRTDLTTPARRAQRKRMATALLTLASITALVGILLWESPSGESQGRADAAPGLVFARLDAAAIVAPDAGSPDAPAARGNAAVSRGPAYLSVESTRRATIFVDGEKLGTTPIFRAKLESGRHELRAVSASGDEQRLRFQLSPGRTKELGRLSW